MHDLLHGLPDPVLQVAEEGEVLGLRGDGKELWREDEVLAPVHDLLVHLCGWVGGRGQDYDLCKYIHVYTYVYWALCV